LRLYLLSNKQLPTTFDDNSYDKRSSASFKSSGRSETFMENNNVYFKNIREENSKTNMGPGMYSVAYEFGNSNNSHFHLLESQSNSSISNSGSGSNRSSPFEKNSLSPKGSHRVSPYEKTWLTGKASPPPASPRAQQIDRDEESTSIDSVRNLPSY
jgi:hypothetical protein